jgi:hypothetical protein
MTIKTIGEVNHMLLLKNTEIKKRKIIVIDNEILLEEGNLQ